jgi:hypothetical protein
MLVQRMQLICDGCKTAVFPPDGAADGALYTVGDLRHEARKRGWKRRNNLPMGTGDVCPLCRIRAGRP